MKKLSREQLKLASLSRIQWRRDREKIVSLLWFHRNEKSYNGLDHM